MTDILDTLEPNQRDLLQQFQAITQSNELEASIAILERNSWNLERSIQRFYEPTPSLNDDQQERSRTPSPSPSRPISSPTTTTSTTTTTNTNTTIRRNRSGLLVLLIWPFGFAWNLTWTVLSFASRILSRRSITSQQSSSQQHQDPKACALRFLREFEKNYGETHVNFSQEGYSQTLEQARRELKFFLVILSSDEHDDTEQFCRHTLANEDLVEFIESKNMLVWGGNVKQVEAHQVSDTLQATTYPFMAVIALHSVGGSAPKMAVMDRLEGSIPPAILIQRLDRTIQRHGAVMNRMKMERDQRDMERRLREEQDKAYQESLKADQEKERKAQQKRRALAMEEEKRQHAQLEHERYLKKRQDYIHYLFHTLSAEPGTDYHGKITKLNFRLANGERVIRKFKETDSIETLYQFVEICPLLQSDQPKPSPILSPPKNYHHKYGFTIHSTFPRNVYQVQDSDRCLLDIPSLWPSATLIVDANDDDDDEEDVD